ncbi:MBL fold metallo-hydrolase [Syntrophomonas palmitatica]|uniref:MBL fold metallo-hydrolase n=1 Tax=Syntrophomonas palmitatica TaxID=402877 RepID=UPI0006D21B42|nr:MBL fold metallo-hydrolase [Syntrophomonas palmitatica]
MLRKITDKISMVISETGFTYCNCIYINDDIRAIIDTGANPRSLAEINPEQVDMVLNTHHHYDHTRGNALFCNARFYIHPFDAPALASPEAFIHYNSIDMWMDIMPGDEFVQAGNMLGLSAESMDHLGDIDGTLKDGEIIDFGSTKALVMHTPGHSAGHCVFFFPEEELLFAGDVCLTKAGPWYGEIYANPDQMIDSIDRIIELNPPRLTSCHVNKIYNDTAPRLTEYKNRIFRRDERIYEFLKNKPATIHDMAEHHLIYIQHPTPFVVFWEKLMLIKHLERLQKVGRVYEAEPGLYYSV